MTSHWMEVAARQSGAISGAQLTELGMDASNVRRMAGDGTLSRQHRDVYTIAGSCDERQELWVAILSLGADAFACRRTAAAEWGLDGIAPGAIDLAVRRGHPRYPGLHRLHSVAPDEVQRLNGMPVTTVSRTLLDLGAAVAAPVLERALESALRRRLVGLRQLESAAEVARVPGSGRLRSVLSLRPPGAPPTESDAETIFVQLVREAGWPDPKRQFTVVLRGKRYRIDFAWPHVRIAVEIDGRDSHGPDRLVSDLVRQNRIILDGWLLLRFSWFALTNRPGEVRSELAAAWALQTTTHSGGHR